MAIQRVSAKRGSGRFFGNAPLAMVFVLSLGCTHVAAVERSRETARASTQGTAANKAEDRSHLVSETSHSASAQNLLQQRTLTNALHKRLSVESEVSANGESRLLSTSTVKLSTSIQAPTVADTSQDNLASKILEGVQSKSCSCAFYQRCYVDHDHPDGICRLGVTLIALGSLGGLLFGMSLLVLLRDFTEKRRTKAEEAFWPAED